MRKYQFNESRFAQLESAEEVYWLGFLLADGNVQPRSLRVELSNKDRDHLEKFKSFMSTEAPIKNTCKDCCKLLVCSTVLVQHLAKYGIVPNKSNVTYTPNQIPSSLLGHFFRGVFDGDGWVTQRYNKYTTNYEISFSSGSSQFINEIWDWITSKVGRRCGYLVDRKRDNQQVFQLQFGGNNIFQQIVNILYDGADVVLDRKWESIQRALETIQQERLLIRGKEKEWNDEELLLVDWETRGCIVKFLRSKIEGLDTKLEARYRSRLKKDLRRLGL